MIGLSPKDLDETVSVWGCNWASFSLFEAMSTQWRTGTNGATGLDYNALPAVMRLLGIPAKQRANLFHDLRVMEGEVLRSMDESRGKQ